MTTTENPEVEIQSHEDWAREDVERRRLKAYADPSTGSDRFFAQSVRLSAIGQVEAAKEANALGLARYNEIKETYSLPYDMPDTSLPVPQAVTMRQAQRELHERGLLEGVIAVINALPEPQKSKALIDWDRSSELHRNNPFVALLGSEMNLSEQQLDELFVEASKIP